MIAAMRSGIDREYTDARVRLVWHTCPVNVSILFQSGNSPETTKFEVMSNLFYQIHPIAPFAADSISFLMFA